MELTPADQINHESLYHQGMIELAMGDTIKAIKTLKQAYRIPEPDSFGMRIKKDIEKVLNELKS